MKWTNSYSLEQTGAFIKTARRAKGLTQDDFSKMIGVSHATLSSLENGKGVSTQTLDKALSFLGFRLVIVEKSAKVEVSSNDSSAMRRNLNA